MFRLIKERFDLWCRTRWLKAIDKEINKYNKLKSKLTIQSNVIDALANRYCELYKNTDGTKDTVAQDNQNNITLENIKTK